ncbi:MAG: hypothetical protein ABI359_08120 [Ginsengibacter sp.]
MSRNFCPPGQASIIYLKQNIQMKKQSFPACCISGAIGKKIVFKQYRNGTVITRYPDMTRIVASGEQRECRNLFKDAVAFAKEIVNDPVKKKIYAKKIKKGDSVYHFAIKEYIAKSKRDSREI